MGASGVEKLLLRLNQYLHDAVFLRREREEKRTI